MIGTGLAILGAGLLGAGASIYGAKKASETQQNAAAQAAAVQQQAMAYQKQNYDKASDNLDPFIKGGQGANNLLQSFYGIGGDPALGASALARFQQSPDYTFALRGGSDALDNSAAAKGGMISGNQIRAQTEYGAGLATQNLQNYLTRLSGMSQQGLTAGGYLGQIGTGTGSQVGASSNNIGNSIMAGGTAEAAGINGMVKGFDSGLNSLSLYNQMGKSSYTPAGNNYLASYNGDKIGGLY